MSSRLRQAGSQGLQRKISGHGKRTGHAADGVPLMVCVGARPTTEAEAASVACNTHRVAQGPLRVELG